MKKIHLIRHAKSSREDESLADIDRPLNERGVRACRFMARQMYNAGCPFENVFCSPALRARTTITLIRESLAELDIQWQIAEALYTADSHDLLKWCRSADESISALVLIGHNPALTDFCNELSHGQVRNIPTCGYVQLTARKKWRWRAISAASFELTAFLRPKKLMKCGICNTSGPDARRAGRNP